MSRLLGEAEGRLLEAIDEEDVPAVIAAIADGCSVEGHPRSRDITPLELTMKRNNLTILGLLLRAGLKLKGPNCWVLAIEHASDTFFEALLNAGMDCSGTYLPQSNYYVTHAGNIMGGTAICNIAAFAQREGRDTIVQMLKDRGVETVEEPYGLSAADFIKEKEPVDLLITDEEDLVIEEETPEPEQLTQNLTGWLKGLLRRKE